MPEDVEQIDIDKELVDLLETISTEDKEDPRKPPEPEPESEPEPEPAESEGQKIPPDPPLKENKEIELPKTVSPEIVDAPEDMPEDDLSIPLKELTRKFGERIDVVFENSILDRVDIQEVIDYCKGVVDESGRVPSVVIESWVKAATAKADININSTKLLDSIAKFLAAAKNNNIFVVCGEAAPDDFEALLNQDARFDEE